jgi:hypothetical protein
METQDLQQAVQLISKDFDLESGTLHDYNALSTALTKAINFLLNKDFEKLLQICYRVDLGEQELNRLLHETNPETMAEEIAEALIKRQLQKIALRKKYSA